MTMKIEITVPEDIVTGGHADIYLNRALGAIGFTRGATLAPAVTLPTAPTVEQAVAAVIDEQNEVLADEGPNYAAMKAMAEAPKRERGKPAPGRARRTREEIAEDEAADAAEAPAPTTEEKPLISTGEERIDPTTAEDAAQDKADEQAEAEATAPVELTHDSVRDALGAYVRAFGMEATMVDGPAIFAELYGDGKAKVSDIPNTQEALAQAVAAVEAAIASNRFERARVA